MRNLKTPKKIILLLAGLVLLIRLIMSLSTGYFSCYNCYGYPDWWRYAYAAKLALAIILLFFALREKRRAHLAIVILILLTAATVLVYESNPLGSGLYLLIALATTGYFCTGRYNCSERHGAAPTALLSLGNV